MLIDDLLDFIFPRFCVICDTRLTTQEKHLCLSCYMHLPRTLYHTVEHSNMEKLFWGYNGQLPIQKAVAFFHYNDSNKNILMQLKYNECPSIGTYLASMYAREIVADGNSFFDDIDVIVPIPLHWQRRIKRGYNQSEYVARGISNITGIPVCTNAVKRIKNNTSQTLLHHEERRDNVDGIFRLVRPEMVSGKHILIVDDVTTTGATISSCAQEIAKAQKTRVSVLTIAIAGQTPIPPNDAEPLPYISINHDKLSKL